MDTILQWIESYLHGRTAQVEIKNFSSTHSDIPCDVSQGSHLSPLLFILFINDISNAIYHSELLIYADNTKMYRKIESAGMLQRDIDALIEWSVRIALDLRLNGGSKFDSVKGS